MIVVVTLAAKSCNVFTGRLIEDLDISMRGTGCQDVAISSDIKIFNVLELSRAGAASANTHQVLEFELFGVANGACRNC